MNNTLPVLRPMRMGELLDQAIRLYRKNFFTFMGIIALVYVPISVLPMLSSLLMVGSLDTVTTTSGNPLLAPGYLSGLGVSLLALILNTILLQGLATAALTRAVADSTLGKPAGMLEAYKRVGKSWLTLLGALILGGLIFIVVILFSMIPCIGSFTGPGLAFFLIAVVLPLIAPVVVIEKTGAGAGLRRAWDLSRRRFWWLLGFRLILMIFSVLVVSGPSFLVSYLVRTVGGDAGTFLSQVQLQSIASSLTSLVSGLLYYPIQMTAITLAYFDLRVRTEGFDLALLTVEPSGETGVEASVQAPVLKENIALITWKDVGYSALLSVGFIAVYAIIILAVAAIGMAVLPSGGF